MRKAAGKRQGKEARKRGGKEKREERSAKASRNPRKEADKPEKWWQFKHGNCVNPAGGPKTARRVLNDDFIADLQEAWKTSGKALIERAIECYPDVFLYANAAIVPPELRSKINGLTDKDAVFGARMLAACADLKPLRDGSRPASSGHLTMTGSEHFTCRTLPAGANGISSRVIARIRSRSTSTTRAKSTTSGC